MRNAFEEVLYFFKSGLGFQIIYEVLASYDRDQEVQGAASVLK